MSPRSANPLQQSTYSNVLSTALSFATQSAGIRLLLGFIVVPLHLVISAQAAAPSELTSLRSMALPGSIEDKLEVRLLESHDGSNWVDFANAPSLWPITGRVTSPFGERENPFNSSEAEFHPGIDIAADVGTPVHATANGTVIVVGDESGYGRYIAVNNGHGIVTVFAHLSGFAVAEGEQVRIGEVLGYVGNTGRSTGPHLFYEVRIHGTPVNPHPFMHATGALTASRQECGLAVCPFKDAKIPPLSRRQPSTPAL